jgi:hypothetical protein
MPINVSFVVNIVPEGPIFNAVNVVNPEGSILPEIVFAVNIPETIASPDTVSFDVGIVVPIPTFETVLTPIGVLSHPIPGMSVNPEAFPLKKLAVMIPEMLAFPTTSNFVVGRLVPIPTKELPVAIPILEV